VSGKDQIKVLSKQDFKSFCDKCRREEGGDGQAFSADRFRALGAGDPPGVRSPAADSEVV